ncbi:hypothetical protein [Pseudomonas petrae]|uniref:Uncharacterized protein n=1 Tax=Pseudomonas petrae TaxID=2912190 RepID=A0ABS9I7Z9_9PSED|nr:hypothetical protein [Pseudomonas petrae]MCF7532999.1 hypothetical protein [Pseudomonas petrae]MCF7535645.1 hypothetical protein [Pseudomonas petrae]MCF7543171.1 hypothetical protein [Pseudomonas petrae]MCF7554707.1 hypothetical protein [Pseudomonas petrae]
MLDMGLHLEELLFPFLGLMHLGISLPCSLLVELARMTFTTWKAKALSISSLASGRTTRARRCDRRKRISLISRSTSLITWTGFASGKPNSAAIDQSCD